MKHAILLCVFFVSTTTSAAEDFACYENPGTLRYTCIDKKAVQANGDIRGAFVYTGSRNGVDKTSNMFLTNCSTGASTLQDRQGVNFAGNMASANASSKLLAENLCQVKKPRSNAKLRQF